MYIDSIPVFDISLQKKVKEISFLLIKNYIQQSSWSNIPRVETIHSYLTEFYRNLLLPLHVARRHSLPYKKGDFLEFMINDTTIRNIPLVNELLENHISECIATVSTLSQRFIETTQQHIDAIQIVGDIHPLKHTKLLVSTKKSKYIIYPASHTSDDLVAFLFQQINPSRKSFFPSYIIDYERDLVIREYKEVLVNTSHNNDIEEYYFHLGEALAFFGSIRTIDLNYDNVICTLPYPLFFDFECICLPKLNQGSEEYNIHHTGFLDPDNANNVSLLYGGYAPNISYMDPILSIENNYPKLHRTTYSNARPDHLPIFNTKIVDSSDFIDYFHHGFIEASNSILKKRKIIKDYLHTSSITTRILLRPTRIYATLHRHIAVQLALGKDKKFIIDLLFDLLSAHTIIPQMQPQESFITLELDYVLSTIIPSRYSNINSCCVQGADNKHIGTLPSSPKDVTIQHLNTLEERYKDQGNKIISLIAK